ncbi:MAG: nitrate ABC transporter permease [Pseudomonadota bacterium]|uniref:nitrate ABC transporter permease n=1 Tax=unclassified Phenylobacterium TaxID=2640670 RepID=UPI0006FBDC87|nr:MULTISPECIES: nitrate ABC transporter permease [unclassified Phenylobacterium]KRB41720.1 ABC transporter permease [Phenylobacterium sp. Root700]MBT9474034.1 nitrate ABC transporter permease [Phenylobacterium sp.]
MSLPAQKFEIAGEVESPASLTPATATRRPTPGPSRATRVFAVVKAAAAGVLPPAAMLLVLLGLWQLLAGDGAGLPAPSMIWLESKDLILDPFFDNGGVDKGLFWHVTTSLSRVGVGFGLAAVVGIALGVLVGANLWAHRGLDPLFQVLRTVPPLAWLPISLAAFREAQPSALFVIFITSIWPIIINTAVGVRNLPADYVNVSRTLSLSPLEHFWKILLPATTPYIFTGLRIGIGMSWLAIVASEMLLGGVGVGFFIWDQYNSSRISDIVVALIWVGLVGFALDRAVALLGRLVSRGSALS